VESFGFFVELDEYFVEGLVHLTSLHDDYYVHDERGHRLLGEGWERVFKLGDRVTVRLVRVDLMSRHIDFSLVEGAGDGGRYR
jgi:ribonuclease R